MLRPCRSRPEWLVSSPTRFPRSRCSESRSSTSTPGITVPGPHSACDAVRVSLLARRFAPAACTALDDGASLVVRAEGWKAGPGASLLEETGTVAPMAAA